MQALLGDVIRKICIGSECEDYVDDDEFSPAW